MAVKLKNELKKLGKHSAIYGLGNILQTFSSLILLPVYTQFLTTEEYGIKELIALTSDVITILIAVAISGSFFRFYFKYEKNSDKEEVISTTIVAIGGFGLIAIIFLAFFTNFLAEIVLNNKDYYYFFLISFTSMWFQIINGIGVNYLRAKQQSVKFVLVSLLRMLISIGFNIYFIVFLKIGVLGILISTLITAIIISLIVVLPLFIKVGLKFSKSKFLEMLKFGLPLVPSQLSAFIVHLSDRFFIKEFVSISDAGIYSLGYRIGALPSNFISEPFNNIYQPRRLEIYNQENSENVFGKIFTYYLIVIGFGGLMVSAIAKDVLVIMSNEEFWRAHEIIPLVVLATTIFSFHYHLNIGLIVSEKTKYFAIINFSNAIFVLILNYLLIPTYGVFGAVWATIIAFVYKAIMTYYFSSKFFKIYFEIQRILKIFVIVFAIYFISLIITDDTPAISLILKAAFVTISFPIGLFILKFFSPGEKEFLSSTIKSYISK